MSKDCMKILDAPLKCANCDDKHMTNYSNCLKLQIYLDRRNDKNLKDQRNNIMMTRINNISVTLNKSNSVILDGKSYSDAL